jgi:adenosylcobinamide kinase/adenosylcobinamide-phosphate guanylyltransferase
VRSGKSAYALQRAKELGAQRAFIATGEALDEEMRTRVARHREERGHDFRTIEAPRDVAEAVQAICEEQVVVIDCLTLWLTNLLMDELTDLEIEARVDALARVLERRTLSSIVVTNEVGLGIVPENALARRFRDVVGRAHQRFGRSADEVYFAVMGQLLRIKPAPVVAVEA